MTDHVTRERWNATVASCPIAQFLQSFEWGEFQQALGREVERLVLPGEHGQSDGAATVIWRRMPFGQQLAYVPRGPVGPAQSLPALLEMLTDRARRRRAFAIRLDPPAGIALTADEQYRYRLRRVAYVQPPDTLLLDLQPDQEAIRAAMHSKTRYNITLAERHGVTCRFSSPETAEQDLAHFLRLLHETDRRDRIHSFPDRYYGAMLEKLDGTPDDPKTCSARLVLAELNGEVLAANLIVTFGDTVTYNHGASSSAQRNVMAPHALQWFTIQQAKAWGYRWYDFRGIAPENAPARHHFAGITRFKLGFGGTRVTSAGTFDRVVRPVAYSAYTVLTTLMRR